MNVLFVAQHTAGHLFLSTGLARCIRYLYHGIEVFECTVINLKWIFEGAF